MTFDPSTNLGLVALKMGWPDRDDSDRPDWITECVNEDGTVVTRPLTLSDIVAWVERE